MIGGIPFKFTDNDLRTAISRCTSWRGVQRTLGYKDTSGYIGERLRERAAELGIVTDHFTHYQSWTRTDLDEAIQASDNWNQVLRRLRLPINGHSAAKVRGYAEHAGLNFEHFARQRGASTEVPFSAQANPRHLRTAGNSIAAAWFTRRGYAVSVPVEHQPYDLVVEADKRLYRVQVKTATARDTSGAFICRLRRVPARDGEVITYDPADVDFFFVVDAEDDCYIIPIQEVAGAFQVSLSTMEHRKMPR
jgi:hypothetical protein